MSEETAKMFHATYERLAPSYGYETRRESAKPWEEVPEDNRHLMAAVASEVEGRIRLDERAKIVRWLRTKVNTSPGFELTISALERGEHLK